MRKLNLSPVANIGGHRLSVDDLATLQNGNNDLASIVAGLLGSIPVGGLIVAGSDAVINTGSAFGINAGWLHQGGEMWRVVAVPSTAISPPNTGALYFKLNKTPIGTPVVYQSGASFQVHVENTATLEWHATTPIGTNYIPFAGVSFANIQAAFQPLQSGWTSVPTLELTTYINTDNTPSKLNTTSSFYRYKRIGKTMFLQVRAVLNSPTNNIKILFAATNTPAHTQNPTVWAVDTVSANNPQKAEYNATPLPNFEMVRGDATVGTIDFQTTIETT
jgi:hypothetical protein